MPPSAPADRRVPGVVARRAGRRGVLLEVEGGRLDAGAAVEALRDTVGQLVESGRLAAPREIVPGARSLLLDGVDVELALRLLATAPRPAQRATARGELVTVPVVYDGPDLGVLARLWGCTGREVVERHTAAGFRVAFCGFAPGFPYLTGPSLTGLDADVPRRASPRVRVPAGSVALAGRYCGIYPTASPGGWQLLGTTDVRLFDVDRDPPALLPPGTRVRFVEVAGHPRRGEEPGAEPAGSGRALTVVRPGALTTVQDDGRPGLAHLGVPRAGPLDRGQARLANRLVGNDEGAALLETTGDGCALRAGTALTVAVTGAGAAVTVDGRAVDHGVAVGVGPGMLLEVGPASRGVRCYLAVAGGIAVPAVLGSRAADTLSGLGPGRLAKDDVLPVGPLQSLPPAVDVTVPRRHEPVVLRLRPGPRDDELGAAGMRALLTGPWTLSPLSDRVGARLSGPAVPLTRTGELESEGMVLGAVQVPPDGQPVVLLADHPTTGGYPVIGVVDGGLDALAQARPGDPVVIVLAEAE